MGRIVPDNTWFPTVDDLHRSEDGTVTVDPSRHDLPELAEKPLGHIHQALDDRIGWVWIPTDGYARTAGTLHDALEALLEDVLAGYVLESDAADDHDAAEWHYRRSA